MDESDDDFKELCASFFQRVRKNGTKEVSGERKTQKASNSTQIGNKLKRTKRTASKSKTLQGPAEKKPQSGSQAPRTKKQGATKSQESKPAVTVNGGGGVLAPAPDQPVLWERAQSTQTESAPNSDPRHPPSCLMTVVPSPSKPRMAELVLQRMQQFKRADPERLKHASEECSIKATLEENVPKGPPEEMMAGNGYGPELPATESDAAVALALQQEFGREGTSAHGDSLEEKGLFFCQICQKNLSAMNVTRREQHMNRCLDEAEKVLRPSAPQIPECPICGRPFLTLKSRVSHLKQCAVKMEVGPQLLLQAVRQQAAQPEAGSSPPLSSFSKQAGGLKRKGATNRKGPQKRQKVDQPEEPSEDLLVALALSRSEMEQSPSVPALRLESAFSERTRLGAEKKCRRKKPLVSPPLLLVQDSKTTGRQIEDRVALLLSEEVELSSTPPLPASRMLKEELPQAGWCLRQPEGRRPLLWEGSALTGARAVEFFYTASLVPPLVPQRPAQGLTQEPMLPLVPPEQPEQGVQGSPVLHSSPAVVHGPRDPSPSASQRERQALQDLVDLAGEGLSASPRPSSGGLASLGGATGLDMVPTSLPLTGFVLPSEEKHPERGGHASLSLGLLVANFSAMVNNPHLSDVQFQTDSGEVLYAHKFVLYARCPLLSQYVNNEGFSAVEDGDLTQRVLLSDVSTEAAHAFLSYLYTADASCPSHLVPELSSLALRFGVSEIVHLCEQEPFVPDSEDEQQQEDENCGSRVQSFQALLRSVWVDEEEEAETALRSEDHEEDREKVNEAEMEEIYEFAATQRKLLQGNRVSDTDRDTGPFREDSLMSGCVLASGQGDEQLETAERMESPGPEREEATAIWEILPLQGQHSDGEWEAKTPEQGAPKETCGRSSLASPPRGCQPQGKGGSCLLPVDVHDSKQLFPSTRREFSESSQITSDHEEHSGTGGKWGAEISHPVAPRQNSPPQRCCFLSQPPCGRSPSRSHLHSHYAIYSAPLTPPSHGGVSRVSSPKSPSVVVLSKQRRVSSILMSSKEPGRQKGKERSSMWECKNKGVLISPEKPPSIDLTQSNPDHLSFRSQNSSSSVKKEDEVILLLDSDEELELEKNKIKSVSDDPPEERNILEISLNSSELFSVIDVDADQEHSQSPPMREAMPLQEEDEGQLESQGSLGRRGAPWLHCDHDHDSGPNEDTTDTSWLVPATPLVSRSRDCSSQTQITSLSAKTSGDETTLHMPRDPVGNRQVSKAAQKISVIMPQIPPPCRDPVTPEASSSGWQVYRSPSRPHPGRQERTSPLPPHPTVAALADLTGHFQKRSPPGPSLPNLATASEVVEVEDSEDEQEVASHQANSSPRHDSDSPIPVDDCCWQVEPLSPIPIDHLNLERTGPLSTSSPSSRAREAPDSGDCRSPGLLGTTPIRGSCAARKKSREKSSWASSPGSSRLSFLNSALWDDWNGEEKSPEALHLVQTPSADGAQKTEGLEKPKGADPKNLPPKVPITPMPRYSIMETPVLKKELDRFGVRPLPKRQMVLKLKEIFQYTHQTLESGSEDEIPASQAPLEAPCSWTHTTETYKPPRARGRTQQEAPRGPMPQRSKGPTKTRGPRPRRKQPSESIPPPSQSPAEEAAPGPEGDTQLPASQESVATSVEGSDSSFSSQSSSSCEFGTAFESAGEAEEAEAGVSTLQMAVQATDTEEVLRRYIRSQPALYRKVLLYQPFELAELQAQLKQNGIHVATGKLLDFLDAHCITFTTAAARKDNLKGKRLRPTGKKKGERK
ncbi:structure-specific endonuclease subunit SLX4 isoform X2 [Cynocephalus volans]|uniref:structure-specific endonuclease subunit SLX4 isoform X2 n=1 Tax=Cynocephalus volans TaxID=110931 RepID=UPI002FC7379D